MLVRRHSAQGHRNTFCPECLNIYLWPAVLQDDLPAAEARALLGPRRILGVSVKTPEQAVAAAAAGADYLGAGAGGEGFGDWSLTFIQGQLLEEVVNGHVTTTCVR